MAQVCDGLQSSSPAGLQLPGASAMCAGPPPAVQGPHPACYSKIYLTQLPASLLQISGVQCSLHSSLSDECSKRRCPAWCPGGCIHVGQIWWVLPKAICALLFQMAGSVLDGAAQQRLPTSATCVNLLKLPPYQAPGVLRDKLLLAIRNAAGFDLS